MVPPYFAGTIFERTLASTSTTLAGHGAAAPEEHDQVPVAQLPEDKCKRRKLTMQRKVCKQRLQIVRPNCCYMQYVRPTTSYPTHLFNHFVHSQLLTVLWIY